MILPRLKISENSRYFVTEDGQPFFWLADTAWTIASALHWREVELYFDKRVEQGFTIVQIVALDPEGDLEMRTPCGEKALLNDDLSTPNLRYFEHLDNILTLAEEKGLYVLLLPAWGQLVVGENWFGGRFPKTVNEKNAYAYGEFLGNRYKEYTNILWCLGGDRHPIHNGVDYKNVWRRLAEGLSQGLTGEMIPYNAKREVWRDLPLTYHTCYDMDNEPAYSTTTHWGEEDRWISYIMLQSGHKQWVRSYEQVAEDYHKIPTRPVWDGEPNYEDMPTSWPPAGALGYHRDWSVRLRAYWSMFGGAFGYTYGHSSVWRMVQEWERADFRPFTWFEALERPGAMQMQHLRHLLTVRPFHRLLPKQEMILTVVNKDAPHNHQQACLDADQQFALVYLTSGGETTADVSALTGPLQAWWWNPRDGFCYSQNNKKTTKPFALKEEGIVTLQSPTAGPENDWVLVIERSQATLLPLVKSLDKA